MSGISLPANAPLEQIKATLESAARAADKETMPLFRASTLVTNKLSSGFDPVTQADKNAETAIRAVIGDAFPDHQIIGEEHENKLTQSPYAWTIDPIDGTRAFISGVPVWGTLIGVSFEGKNFAGIMSQPFNGETFLALPDHAIYTRAGTEQALKTSGQTDLTQAKLFSTDPNLFQGDKRAAFDRVCERVLLARYSCDCYGYALLAAGQADLVIEPSLNSYDIAALIPIIENAGGIITTTQGAPADQGGDIIAAATAELHRQAMQLYNQA